MKVTKFTREALAFRREHRRLTRAGYRQHETDWEIHRGCRYNERIIDAKISVDWRYVYTLLGKEEGRLTESKKLEALYEKAVAMLWHIYRGDAIIRVQSDLLPLLKAIEDKRRNRISING